MLDLVSIGEIPEEIEWFEEMTRNKMIYLNHAGTSWPKPEAVLEVADHVYQQGPAAWPNLFAEAHGAIADFFHVDKSRLLLTPSCTTALNLAITDHLWQPGDRVLTTCFEHHALWRNLEHLEHRGVQVITVPPNESEMVDLERLRTELGNDRTRLVAMTAACNVTGWLLPIRDVLELSQHANVPVLLDGAQIAGWWDLDLAELGVDLFTFAGHKGLQAPWGVGGLYVAPSHSMVCSKASCEIAGEADEPPMPGYCDAGSANLGAVVGLSTACRWLGDESRKNRLEKAQAMAAEVSKGIRHLSSVRIHHDVAPQAKMPTVAFSHERFSAATITARLASAGVIASAGIQCAPQAHQQLGTERNGVVRLSFGPVHEEQVGRILNELVAAMQ